MYIEKLILLAPTWAEFFNVFIPFIIGALVSVIGQMYLAWYQVSVNQKKTRDTFITIIKDSLINTINVFKQIVNDYDMNKRVDSDQINKFNNSRKIYDKFIENIVLIEPHAFRSKISDYFLNSTAFIDRLKKTQKTANLIQERIIKLEMDTPSPNPQEENNKRIMLISARAANEHFDMVIKVYVEEAERLKNEAADLLGSLEPYKT